MKKIGGNHTQIYTPPNCRHKYSDSSKEATNRQNMEHHRRQTTCVRFLWIKVLQVWDHFVSRWAQISNLGILKVLCKLSQTPTILKLPNISSEMMMKGYLITEMILFIFILLSFKSWETDPPLGGANHRKRKGKRKRKWHNFNLSIRHMKMISEYCDNHPPHSGWLIISKPYIYLPY